MKKNHKQIFALTIGVFFIASVLLIYLSVNSDKPGNVLGAGTWDQSDWSGGQTSGAFTDPVTTYSEISDIDTSTNLSLGGNYPKIATFKSTQNNQGSNYTINDWVKVDWNVSQEYNENTFSFNPAESTKLTVDEAGDYFFSLLMLFEISENSEDNHMQGFTSEVYINGIRNEKAISHNSLSRSDSGNILSNNLSVLLESLNSGDYIEIYVKNNTDYYATIPSTATSTAYLEKVDDTEDIFYAWTQENINGDNGINTDSTTSFVWNSTIKDSPFTFSEGGEYITINETGNYFIAINIPLENTSGNEHTNCIGILAIDDTTEIDFPNSYIRERDNHVYANLQTTGLINISQPGQQVNIRHKREAGVGSVVIPPTEKATLLIWKANDNTGLFRSTSANINNIDNNWSPNTADNIIWENNTVIDTDSFTHTATPSDPASANITVKEPGVYLGSYQARLTFDSSMAPVIKYNIDGTPITGAVSQTTFGYTLNNHDLTSSDLLFPIKTTSTNQIVTTTMQTANGYVDRHVDITNSEARFVLWQKGYESDGYIVSNIFDSQQNSNWDELIYTTGGTGSITVKARTQNDPDFSDAPDWSTCSAIVSGDIMSEADTTCINNTDQYIQYRVDFEATDPYNTPTLNSISLAYSPADNVSPKLNATEITMTGLNDGDWTNTPPTINWTAGADDDDGAGLDGYCVALDEVDADTSSTPLDPANSAGVLHGLNDGFDDHPSNCGFIATGTSLDLSTVSGLNLTTGKEYYFSIKAVDSAGNIWTGDPPDYIEDPIQFQDMISFKYDDDVPSNPSYISLPGNFVSNKAITITWPTNGEDAPQDDDSGFLGLQYKIGDGPWYGDLHLGSEDTTDLLVNDGAYTMDETVDFPLLLEGSNFIYIRTWDNAGNVTTNYTSGVIKINTTAPSQVGNLTVNPTSSTANQYSFQWEIPDTYIGSGAGISYCYTVNTLPSETTCNYTAAGQTSLSAGAYATQPGSNTMYVVARDEAYNINYDTYTTVEFSYTGSAPGIATNVDLADISVKSTQKWRLALAWDEPTELGAGVSKYDIYRSNIEGANCSESLSGFSKVGSTSGQSYVDTGLQQTTYYYCLKACDSANNCGAVSSTVSKYPDGKFTEPANLIVAPEVQLVTTKRAVINWVTERNSDTKVAYGLESGVYFEDEAYRSGQTTNHSIILNNLSPDTTHYFVAKWTDEDGNTGISDEIVFKTDPAPTVRDIEVTNVTTSSASIKLATVGATRAKVYYGKTDSFGGLEEFATSTEESTYYSQLSNLDDGSKYYFKINPVDVEGEEYEGTILSFETIPYPRINQIFMEEKPNSAQPTIKVSWTTNTPTTSVIEYYPKDDMEKLNKVIDLESKTEHQLEVTNLKPETDYILTVTGTDAIGNKAISAPQTFRTDTDNRPPIISNVLVETAISQSSDNQDNAQIIVSWDTDESATGQIEYSLGTTDDYQLRTTEDLNLVTSHVLIISDLEPSKVYQLRVASRDAAGNVSYSTNQIVVTPKPGKAVSELILDSLRDIFVFVDF